MVASPLRVALDVERVRVAVERALCDARIQQRAALRTDARVVSAEDVRRSLLENGVRLTPQLAPEAYALARRALDVLGVDQPMELYQRGAATSNAHVVSCPDVVIIEILGRWLVDLDAGAMLALLGHELGHALAHAPSSRAGAVYGSLHAVSDKAGRCHLMAAELTADRFGLLACQDLDAVLRLGMEATMGVPQTDARWDTRAYLDQARELIDGVRAKGEAVRGSTHPEHAMRAYASWLFSESDLYDELTGHGPGSRSIHDVNDLVARLLGAGEVLRALGGEPESAARSRRAASSETEVRTRGDGTHGDDHASVGSGGIDPAAMRTMPMAPRLEAAARSARDGIARLFGRAGPAEQMGAAFVDPLEDDHADLDARFAALERRMKDRS